MGYYDIQIAKQSALAGRTPEEEKRNRAAHAEQEARLVEQARREEYKKMIAQMRSGQGSRW
jgi:hypothetical protein